MRQISNQDLNNGYTHVGIPTISITSDVLGYDDNVKWVFFLDSPKMIVSYIIQQPKSMRRPD